MTKNKKKAFESYGGGFHITFKNGITLSTQYKTGNHADNYDGIDFAINRVFKSETCEIAILDSDDNFITRDVLDDLDDDVKGWVSFDEWLKILKICENYKTN